MQGKTIAIEYLYLDLTVCDRCIGTDAVLRNVIRKLTPAFELAGYKIELDTVEIKDMELAERHRLETSPTIRVNGNDICTAFKESDCGCCGDIGGVPVDCRVFVHEGEEYDVPPESMVAEGIIRYAFSDAAVKPGYRMPENLVRFFENKGSDVTILRKCC